MKKILVAIMAGLIISVAMPTMAQRHRHTPLASVKVDSQTDKDGNTKRSAAIVAFSDTTDTEAADSLDEDSLSDAGTYGWDKPYDLDKIGNIMQDAFLPIALVFIMFFLTPVMIIGLIIYFIIKSRKQKIQLAELALKNGQPIPQDMVKNNKVPNDQDLWAKGIKKIFIGIGIVVMAIFISSGLLKGIGFLVAFYGAGQAVIAWTTKKNIAPSNSPKEIAPSNSPKGEKVDESLVEEAPSDSPKGENGDEGLVENGELNENSKL